MSKKQTEKKRKNPKQEQLDLIDIAPANQKELIKHAKLYKDAVAERQAWLDEEVKQKQKLLELTKSAGIKPDANGVIKFKVDGYTIIIKSRDELVQVKESE
jgi:hypothetical protein